MEVMEDYYKEEYKKTYKLFQQQEREAHFYKHLTYFICGMTNAICYFFFVSVSSTSVVLLETYWNRLSISDIVALIALMFAVVGVVFRYRHFIFNWPEALFLKALEKEKEDKVINSL